MKWGISKPGNRSCSVVRWVQIFFSTLKKRQKGQKIMWINALRCNALLSSEYLCGIFNKITESDNAIFPLPQNYSYIQWLRASVCITLTVWQCEWGGVSLEVAASVPPWSLFLPSGPRPDLARWRGTSPIKAAHCDKAISFPSASL